MHRSPSRAAATLACLSHWAQRRLPLVVTRQPLALRVAAGDRPDGPLALGVSAPATWGRHAIAVTVSPRGVCRHGAFPLAVALTDALPAAARDGWAALCRALDGLGVTARVYGSRGWQHLTGLDHVHAASDVDLLVEVGSAAQADRAGALLHDAERLPLPLPLRLDGELVFGDGAAVAWREWSSLRAGQTAQMLVKRLHGSTLEDGTAWAASARGPPA